MFVRYVMGLVVHRAQNRNHVEHVMELEWKQFKRVHFSCALRVDLVMGDEKLLRNHVTNVQEKAKQFRKNTQQYRSQLVCHHTKKRCFFFSISVFHIGIEDGQTMKVNLGISEVFITFRVKPSDRFRRQKEDIHSDVLISIAQAILGGTIKVPGLFEDHLLEV